MKYYRLALLLFLLSYAPSHTHTHDSASRENSANNKRESNPNIRAYDSAKKESGSRSVRTGDTIGAKGAKSKRIIEDSASATEGLKEYYYEAREALRRIFSEGVETGSKEETKIQQQQHQRSPETVSDSDNSVSHTLTRGRPLLRLDSDVVNYDVKNGGDALGRRLSSYHHEEEELREGSDDEGAVGGAEGGGPERKTSFSTAWNQRREAKLTVGQGELPIEITAAEARAEGYPKEVDDGGRRRSWGVMGGERSSRAGSVGVQRATLQGHTGEEHTRVFLNEWVVHVPGGRKLATALAKDLGYEFYGQIGDFEDVYRMVKSDHPTRHKRAAHHLTQHLNAHTQVVWAEQQFVKERSKRGLVAPPKNDPLAPLARTKRQTQDQEKERNNNNSNNMAAAVFEMEKMFNDELWDHQWYLFDTRTRPELPKLDLQVVGAWQSGVTGEGVRVQVIDDGLEWRHSDIKHNYDPEISYDFNNNKDDPTPRYDNHLSNSHGTKCAGEVVMSPNNHKCGVGVAHGAKVGGVKILDGSVSDMLEGRALSHALRKVDVVSCSWGPTDDGTRVEGPGTLAKLAIQEGVRKGREGRGIIYVWAAGNGGSSGDNCNCDGYTSSVMTLSISSASETGKFPWYGERCTSTLATAYSSGAYTDQKIATTDLNDTCTVKFTGTSASAPLAAGIVALALQVNGNLTWRDMQHAVVWTSEWGPLSHNDGWTTNAKGLKVNPRFGFGLLNAKSLVEAVGNWTSVPDQRICRVKPVTSARNLSLSSGGWVTVEMKSDGCEGTQDEVRWLEHVQVVTTITYTRRGALSITLTSPHGTVAELLTERLVDASHKGFLQWPFMSVHTWGEDPRGTWTLNVSDSTHKEENGEVGEIELVLYGTKQAPGHMMQERVYKIQAAQVEERESRENADESDKLYLTPDQLRTMSWDQLVQLLTKSTRSTMSGGDVEWLLREGRLVSTLHVLNNNNNNIRGAPLEPQWKAVLKEIVSRYYLRGYK